MVRHAMRIEKVGGIAMGSGSKEGITGLLAGKKAQKKRAQSTAVAGRGVPGVSRLGRDVSQLAKVTDETCCPLHLRAGAWRQLLFTSGSILFLLAGRLMSRPPP